MNPWLSVWFQPQRTAEWVKNTKPLYGVVLVLILYLLISLVAANVSFFIGADEGRAAPIAVDAVSGGHRLGLMFDTWLMPIVLLVVTYLVGKYLGGQASIKNILWVLVWSQLPILLLSLVTIAMELAGMQIGAPVFSNKISFTNGQPLLDPPMLEVNGQGFFYFLVSMPLLLWSFQILLSGTAAVQGVTVKRAIWFIVIAMIIVMLIRLPLTLALGDWDILDVLGLQGIVELNDASAVAQ